MALTRFSGADEIIRLLDDQPNDNNGLSAAELKAKFDEFASTFKEFFNGTFIPEVESAISAAASGIAPTGISGSVLRDRSISGQKLINTEGFEAVSTDVVRAGAITLPKLAVAIQTLLNSVPGKAIFSQVEITLTSAGWVNNQQTVSVEGVTATNAALASGGNDTTSHTAWSNNDIWGVSQGDGTMTFQCRTAPSSDITVNVLILDTEG